jgi:hypothetical protein
VIDGGVLDGYVDVIVIMKQLYKLVILKTIIPKAVDVYRKNAQS